MRKRLSIHRRKRPRFDDAASTAATATATASHATSDRCSSSRFSTTTNTTPPIRRRRRLHGAHSVQFAPAVLHLRVGTHHGLQSSVRRTLGSLCCSLQSRISLCPPFEVRLVFFDRPKHLLDVHSRLFQRRQRHTRASPRRPSRREFCRSCRGTASVGGGGVFNNNNVTNTVVPGAIVVGQQSGLRRGE